MGKCVSLRDSEKSLEKTRMDLYRSPFFSCENPLICYYIFKWNQFVVNSARLQGYKASAVKQKMETSLHLDPETISIHSVNSKQQLILSNRGVEVEGWFKSRKWNLSLWMYILICNFLCIYDISSNIISLVHWPSGKFLMNLLNAEDSTQLLGRYFAMVKRQIILFTNVSQILTVLAIWLHFLTYFLCILKNDVNDTIWIPNTQNIFFLFTLPHWSLIFCTLLFYITTSYKIKLKAVFSRKPIFISSPCQLWLSLPSSHMLHSSSLGHAIVPAFLTWLI